MNRNNTIRDEFRNHHGHVMPELFRIGETIDEANDCHYTGDLITFRHLNFDARRAGTVKVGNSLLGAACDAITIWERHHNPHETGTLGDEDMLLYGC